MGRFACLRTTEKTMALGHWVYVGVCICLCVSMCVSVCVSVSLFVSMYVPVYVSMCVSVFVSTCVCGGGATQEDIWSGKYFGSRSSGAYEIRLNELLPSS